MRDETEGRSEGLRGRPQLRLCPIGDGEIGGGFRAAEGCVCVCVCEEHRGWAGLGAGRKAGLTIQKGEGSQGKDCRAGDQEDASREPSTRTRTGCQLGAGNGSDALPSWSPQITCTTTCTSASTAPNTTLPLWVRSRGGQGSLPPHLALVGARYPDRAGLRPWEPILTDQPGSPGAVRGKRPGARPSCLGWGTQDVRAAPPAPSPARSPRGDVGGVSRGSLDCCSFEGLEPQAAKALRGRGRNRGVRGSRA